MIWVRCERQDRIVDSAKFSRFRVWMRCPWFIVSNALRTSKESAPMKFGLRLLALFSNFVKEKVVTVHWNGAYKNRIVDLRVFHVFR